MKCPKCGGTGEMQICEMGFIGKDECDKCHGKGYLTNDEWRKTCSTEEFAEAILQQWIHGAYHGVGEFGLTDKEIESARDGIIEWLKEKRDESV